MRIFLIVFFLLTAPCLSESFPLDSDRSTLTFSITTPLGEVKASGGYRSGTLTLKSGKPSEIVITGSSKSLSFDTQSLQTQLLIQTLLQKLPEGTVEARSMKFQPAGNNLYRVSGTVTALGKVSELESLMTAEPLKDGGFRLKGKLQKTPFSLMNFENNLLTGEAQFILTFRHSPSKA